jgi:hypothetical protein
MLATFSGTVGGQLTQVLLYFLLLHGNDSYANACRFYVYTYIAGLIVVSLHCIYKFV